MFSLPCFRLNIYGRRKGEKLCGGESFVVERERLKEF
jgi:hypothetical protein